jgi:hypothetical protein
MIVTVLALAACGRTAPETASPPEAPRWIVDPREPGPSLPPTGRSLFDHLLADGLVPYPFEALLAAIERQAGADGVARVLIPRGRSLQREAAAPDFFAFPRAVVAAIADGPESNLADRLFVAYHERAAVLEVVSYNEAAGRFEFQVVRDYRAGARPRVAYANRELCTTCHQNGGPIFARPLWDETNASPEIAARLRDERASFYGLPARADVDAAYAVDNATDRGNLLAAWQLLWSEGCGDGAAGRRCRAALLGRVVAHRLGDAPTPAAAAGDAVGRAWAERFPHGLLLPTADIPNRLPLRGDELRGAAVAVPLTRSPEARTRLVELVRASDIPSALEPLQPREPAEAWSARDLGGGLAGRVVAGLGGFLTDDDARRLDDRLAALGGPTAVVRSPCVIAASGGSRVSFTCTADAADGFALTGRVQESGTHGSRGSIDSVSFAGVQETGALEVRAAVRAGAGPERRLTLDLQSALSGRRARRADGRRIERLVLRFGATAGTAELTIVDDVAPLTRALVGLAADGARDPHDALDDGPFRRARVMAALERALGQPVRERCCEDAGGLPPADVDGASPARLDAADPLATLRRYCGRCHDTPDRSPPNFLHGEDAPARVAHCSERIAFRLDMWTLPAGERPKTPMPPPAALQALHVPAAGWPSHPDLEELRRTAAAAAGTHGPRPDTSGREYASLPPCLAEAP